MTKVISSNTPMKWCDKSAALAKQLHEANMLEDHAKANTSAALAKIGQAVAEHVSHSGKIPSAISVRSKLSNLGVYKPFETTQTESKAGRTKDSKATVAQRIADTLGIDMALTTLSNSNMADLEEVAKAAAMMRQAIVSGDSELIDAARETLVNTEIDALADGVDSADIAQAEAEAADLARESESASSELIN